MKRPRVALGVVVVLPAGSLAASLGELQRKVASIGDGFRYRVHVTDDQEGGWTRTFGVTRAPAVFLVDAHRELVWKHEGQINPKALAAALDQHATPASLPTARPLQLAVAHGLRAPDLFFNDDSGRPYALHRLRGRHVLVNFWQSWSAPCLTELRRLQHLAARKDTNALFIVSFHGGRDQKAAERIRKELGLPFPVIQDAEQQMARQYGVRCWPTTVLLDADGRVEHVQFGVQHEHT